MLVVHHLGRSQSERIVWLCEELGIEYELRRYDRRADNMMAPEEYKALSPMGIAPVITDGDLTLGESGAIIEYIDGKYGSGRLSPGPDDADFAQHLFWLHFSNGTFMATKMMQIGAHFLGAKEQPPFVLERLENCLNLIEHQLGETDYFGGSKLTTADIMMGFPTMSMSAMGGDTSFGAPSLDDKPNTRSYLERIGKREAYRRAMAKAEPDLQPEFG